MAGVACARRLAKDANVRVTLFDTGRRAIGGRASSKAIKLPDGRHVRWDHALSYITASDPRFNEVCAGWVADGLAAPFEGEVVNVDAAAGWRTHRDSSPRGTAGMSCSSGGATTRTSLLSGRLGLPPWRAGPTALGHLVETTFPVK